MLTRIRITLLSIFHGRAIRKFFIDPIEYEMREVTNLQMSALRTYIEVLEFIQADIDGYFDNRGVSARQTMRRLRDFTGHKLESLNKLKDEYKKYERSEISKN